MPYQHGRFVWFECFTNDIPRTKVFYSELFGWSITPMEMSDGTTYELITSGSSGIGGMMPLEAARSERPFWLGYLSVANVDVSKTNVENTGGSCVLAPFDVSGVGRISIVRDDQGASFGLFKGETGDPELTKSPGVWWWNELWAPDEEAALAFYKGHFGYSHATLPIGKSGIYYTLHQEGERHAGIMKTPDEKISPKWIPYVEVKDVDQIAARAEALGGTVACPPDNTPNVGRYTILRDPCHAWVAAITPFA